MEELANEAKKSADKSGYLYDAMDYILTTLTNTNDSVYKITIIIRLEESAQFV